MSAFATAMAALVADPSLGTTAVWRAAGTGPAVTVRLLRSAPDRVASAFDAAVLQATDLLSIAVADLADLAPEDSIAIGSDLLIVTHAERDTTGVAWRVHCRRGP
jgi:hypothetical protein